MMCAVRFFSSLLFAIVAAMLFSSSGIMQGLSPEDVIQMAHSLFFHARSKKAGVTAAESMDVEENMEINDNGFGDQPNCIVENPTLDLEQMVSHYAGLARLQRLTFIAEHCPALRVEALRLGLKYVLETHNTGLYATIHRKLTQAVTENCPVPDNVTSSGTIVPPRDDAWFEATSKKSNLKLERLDVDLKNYKSNSIKESIRRGHDDLGDHYLDCGDLQNALKSYSRARDYCTNSKHHIILCLNVIKINLYLKNWTHMLTYVNKGQITPDEAIGKDMSEEVKTQMSLAAGLGNLGTHNYKAAAKHFLQISFDYCHFPELLCSSDVAIYGTLCALATFDRQDLHRSIVASAAFKQFLELEPQVRDIALNFYNSRYACCLKLMAEIKDNLMLDMYLSPHVALLYTHIRNRALCQYFSPYLSADMRKMAEAFNTSVGDLENELAHLIMDDRIDARIDSHNKILYAKQTDPRSNTFEKTLAIGREYQRRTQALILRAAVLKNQIKVRGNMTDKNTKCLMDFESHKES